MRMIKARNNYYNLEDVKKIRIIQDTEGWTIKLVFDEKVEGEYIVEIGVFSTKNKMIDELKRIIDFAGFDILTSPNKGVYDL